ncbi:MAG: preprotein translocase subunit SecA [Armatimonadota bacterium]|nr:preprotein translocase subunit SecA [Armatimonadota bacterium]
MSVLSALFSTNEREIRKFFHTVEEINAFEPTIQALSDSQLRAKTDEFRERLVKGETLDDLLAEAFAVVREASKRALGMRHFDVQMIGGMVLHQGRIGEMKTGEGKTLVATLPIYLNALSGKGAHLVTVNDYLSKRDAKWMGPVYHFLGLSVGTIRGRSAETGSERESYLYDPAYVPEDEDEWPELRPISRREAYYADVTYGTNHEFGFDYLYDNMAMSKDELVQRELNYAIVDEVDSILVDEARTPLIISGAAEKATDLYYKADKVVARLVAERDYTVDEKARTAMLTEDGIHHVEEAFGIGNLADPENLALMQHASAALKARAVFKKDVDYVVRDGQVTIVDEFTGRLMFGRRYSDGLHQAIEAKENVKVEEENQTMATITYQNFFRLYDKLAGMTGTAKTEEEEFRKIYALDVVEIPTNQPMVRTDHADVIYKTEEAKFRGITAELLQLYAKQQPVLVGTRSIEVSERLSERLISERLQLLMATIVLRQKLEATKDVDGEKRKQYQQLLNAKFDELTLGRLSGLAKLVGMNLNMLLPDNIEAARQALGIAAEGRPKLEEALRDGITHSVLNAKYHEMEAQIISDAGHKGSVTIATNMAGRGVDIILGGKSESTGISSERSREAMEVVALGGLHILGTERHESRRIDNQLRGRSGRQGDPGSSRFYVSLEDELMRLFGDRSKSFLLSAWQEDMAMDARMLSRMIERAQKKVEEHNFGIRKHVLEYDDVMNVQREVIYNQRRKILEGVDLRPTIVDYLHKTVEEAVEGFYPEGIHPSEWDPAELFETLDEIFPLSIYARPSELKGKRRDELKEFLDAVVERTYADREAELGADVMRDIERHIALRMINEKWIEHLDAMDYLREGIGLRGYAQQDPLVAYKKEAFDMFATMMHSIQDDIVRLMYRVQLQAPPPTRRAYSHLQEGPPTGDGGNGPTGGRAPAPHGRKDKVGRNDPCPCGSGQKFKKCCLPKIEAGGEV